MNHLAIGAVVLAAQVCLFVPEVLSAEALEQWHRRDSPAQRTSLRGVAYGNGLFTAVGENGTVITSPDGVRWTQQACPTTNTLEQVVYGNGLFLAGGSPDTLLVSTNGTDWLSTPCPLVGGTLEGIAFAGGYFFFLTSGMSYYGWPHVSSPFDSYGPVPCVFASGTGTNWTFVRIPGLAGAARDVAYGQGLYAAVGARPELLFYDWWDPDRGEGPASVVTSADAVTWNDPLLGQCPLGCSCPGTSFPYFALRGVAYGRGRFVAVGEGSCVFFPETTNCVETYFPGDARCVCFGDGFFVGGGYLAFGRSTDGINWTALDAGQGLYSIDGVAYGRSTFVAVGGPGLILQSDPIVGLSLRHATPGNGQGSGMELTISGPSGATCQIQCAGGIPASDGWQTVATVSLSNAPTIWVDPQSVGASQRFYRAVLQP